MSIIYTYHLIPEMVSKEAISYAKTSDFTGKIKANHKW